MVSLASNSDLIIAASDLRVVQLIRQAMRAADASQARAGRRHDEDRDDCHRRAQEDRFAPRPVIHPTPRYEPRPVIHPTPRIEPRWRSPEVIVVSPPASPPIAKERPLPAPWMPGFIPRPAWSAPRVKIAPLYPDKTAKGAVLDVFI